MSYPAAVLARFDQPAHAGVLEDAICGQAGTPAGGTQVRWYLAIQAGRVARAAFQAYGCPYVIAAAEWAAEQLETDGRAVTHCPDAREMVVALAVPAEKLGALLVVEDALRAALDGAAANNEGFSWQ